MQEYRHNLKPPFLLREKLIFLSLLIFNLNYILYNSLDVSSSSKNGLRIIAVTMLVFSSLLSKNIVTIKKLDFIWLGILFLTLFSLNISSNFLNFIYIILFIISLRGIEKKIIIEYNYKIMLISIFFVIILLGTGVLNNFTYQQDGRIRNTFGFSNVNAFSNLIYSLFLMIFMHKKKLGKISIIFLTILMYFVYMYTDTRTMMISFLIFIFSYLLLKKIFKFKKSAYNNRVIKAILIGIVSISISLSLLAPVILKKYPQINLLTSNRLSIFSNYINGNTIVNFLFGGTQVPDIDNGYLVILFSTGVIFSFFLLYLIIKALIQLVEHQDYRSIAFIVSFMVFNITEALIIRPELSASMVFWVIVYEAASENKVSLNLNKSDFKHNYN